MKKITIGFIVAVFLLSLASTGVVRADEAFPAGLQMPPETQIQIPGTIEGTGTHFQLTDSQYLNIILDSSQPIKLVLESVPQMITIHIESASGATSADITLGGFLPSTTYHKYEDDYHNHITFVTDASGKYTYTQDISRMHLVFIQPRASTIFLNDSGWSQPVGTWDPATRTGTLTQDVTETIQIDSNSITLDGNGHCVTGDGSGNGVYLRERTGVIIKNLNVRQNYCGIYLWLCTNNTLKSNTVYNNSTGIWLDYSCNNNALNSNTVYNNSFIGIQLYNSSNNTLNSNTAYNNGFGGIRVENSSSNTLTANTAYNNIFSGIFVCNNSSSNTLSGNTVSNTIDGSIPDLVGKGIFLHYTSNNTLIGNTASNANSFGIRVSNSSNNTLIGNTASNNRTQGVSLYNAGNNTLSGNHMSGNGRNDFALEGEADPHFYNSIDTTNLVGGKPIYYLCNKSDQTIDESSNAGTVYLINCSNMTVKGLSLSITFFGVYLRNTNGSRIENVRTGSYVRYGIYLHNSSNNTLSNSTIQHVYLLFNSSNNTITRNTISGQADYALTINSSSGNKVYNNNFINNVARVLYGSNTFNMEKPVGGNYWFNWTSPDSDGDGFVDNPFIFEGGQDNLPWTRRDGWMLDNIAPTTTPSLSGSLGNNGWYTSAVQVTLTATDNPGGSGVKKTEYSYDSTSWNTYTAPFTITSEGTATVYYRSIDNAGNVEQTKTETTKIDKTRPVISISSPEARTYLTSETLTVAFSVGDALSGLAVSAAILDGTTAVTNGQLINLALMAGNHTLTVSATDKAGNSHSVSVTFTVIIASSVDANPDTINLKSQSDKNAVTVYIEFPAGYNVSDIDVATVRMNILGTVLSAQLTPTGVGDYDTDRVPDCMVKFDRQQVIAALGTSTGDATFTVTGKLKDGRSFTGYDKVRVISPGK